MWCIMACYTLLLMILIWCCQMLCIADKTCCTDWKVGSTWTKVLCDIVKLSIDSSNNKTICYLVHYCVVFFHLLMLLLNRNGICSWGSGHRCRRHHTHRLVGCDRVFVAQLRTGQWHKLVACPSIIKQIVGPVCIEDHLTTQTFERWL